MRQRQIKQARVSETWREEEKKKKLSSADRYKYINISGFTRRFMNFTEQTEGHEGALLTDHISIFIGRPPHVTLVLQTNPVGRLSAQHHAVNHSQGFTPQIDASSAAEGSRSVALPNKLLPYDCRSNICWMSGKVPSV